VAEDVTDSDGGFYTFGPYPNGLHNVVVEWFFDATIVILDADVLVECEGQPTTVPTTEAPATTAAPAAEAATQPRFTG
jgi:hypothetical protein